MEGFGSSLEFGSVFKIWNIKEYFEVRKRKDK
jgi:hypothetical protein